MHRQALLLSGMNISLFSWKYLSSYCLRKVLHSSGNVVVGTLRQPVSKSCRALLVPTDGLSAKGAILEPNFCARICANNFCPIYLILVPKTI